MTLKLYNTQKAVHDVLIGDSALLAMLGTQSSKSIIDNPSQIEGLAFPFIRYDDLSLTAFNAQFIAGAEISFSLSVFSRSRSKDECFNILDRIHTLLHDADLEIEDQNAVLCRFDGVLDVSVDDSTEFLLYRGVIVFKIITERSV